MGANRFYTGDDCLSISSLKVSTMGDGREVAKLTDFYRKSMYKGDVYSVCYETEEHKTEFTSIDKVPDNRLHTVKECYEYKLNLDHENTINIKGNKCQVRLLGLLNKTKEIRYTLIVDALVELVRKGILKYSPRVKVLTEKNIREALRNRGLRDWKVEKYEHNIFFTGDIGKHIFDSLKKSDNIPDNDKKEYTIYLRSDKQKETNKNRVAMNKNRVMATIKYYYMLPKHGRDAYKLEITIDREMIKRDKTENLSLISTWLDHPRIQEIKSVHKRLKSGINLLLNELSNEVIGELKIMSGEDNIKNIPDKMLDPFFTLKEVMKRVESNTKDIGAIKKHLGLDTQEKKMGAI